MARPTVWTDQDLAEAIKNAARWNDVVKALGRKPSARATATVQGHALRIGVDVGHLPPIPLGTAVLGEGRQFPREQLAEAVRTARSWAEVMRQLGYSGFSGSRYAAAKEAAAEMGLDVSHLPDNWNKRVVKVDGSLPFSAPPAEGNLRAAAIGEAIAWFLQRGYVPSIPVEPTQYDIVVDSDDGMKKVQVKTTTCERNGQYEVFIARMAYRGDVAANSNGRRTRTPYKPGEVDLFFIVAGSSAKYLIPLAVTEGAVALTLTRKYAAYRVC